MGNIQIKERPPRRSHIFNGKIKSQSRSPFREIITPKSPYYKAFSPIRYSQESHSLNKSSFREQARSVSSRHQVQQSSRTQKAIKSGKKEMQFSENREKCQQIIKKVRNFNDFLLELKKKLREDCCLRNQYKEEKGKVSMNVRLQNEKVELEKYKKLVQRQLSKTHSIQSINIENLSNGQKKLTIQYQNINEMTNDKTQVKPLGEIQLKQPLQPAAFKVNFKKEQKNVLREQIPSLIPKQSSNSMHDIKTTFFLLKQKCQALGQQLSREEATWQQEENSKQLFEKCRQKTEKITTLIERLSTTNSQSLQLQRKIRTMLL